MKTSLSPTARVVLSLLPFALLAPLIEAQTSAISVDRVNYFTQTGASTVAPQAEPFTLNFHIRGGTTNMSNWGPAFYKPGSGGVPQTGASSATNTGTLNFSTTPNNGGSFMFLHDFASNAALESFYPVAPTDGGVYGIQFSGSAFSSPVVFDDGLVFAAGTTYPSVTPRVMNANNGAVWSGSTLRIKPSGVTTLSFNAFPEYSSTTYGSFIAVGLYSDDTVIDPASLESYYLPLGDSSVPPVVPVNQAPVTQVSIDGSWLTPGVTYTMELQYAILAGQPEEAQLGGQEFQGLATYRKLTTITITLQSPPQADFNADGKSDLLWRNTQNGDYAFWLMDGTNRTAGINKGPMPLEWKVAGMGDFNADGKADIIWRNTQNGDYAFWLMDGTNRTAGINKGPMPLQWQISGTGDFNADGQSDIIWRNTQTGEYAFWLMNGTTRTAGINKGVMPLEWQITGTGDFNADAQTDLIWRNTQTGDYAFWLMNGTNRTAGINKGPMPLEWQITK